MGGHGGGPHLTGALGAVVDRPLVLVLAHDSVVDADAAVDADAVFNQLVLVRLGVGGKQEKEKVNTKTTKTLQVLRFGSE